MPPSPSRTEPCPCGSDRRFKDCHGARKPSAMDWGGRALAQIPPRLQGLRDRLAPNRHRSPLFDRHRCARDFDDAMAPIWAAHQPAP